MDAATAAPQSVRPLKVLVVEDNLINQKVAIRILGMLGHTGVVVGDGEKALQCLSQLRFDVVLMDVMMPILDGPTTVATIREREAASGGHQAIIMVTSHAEPGDAARFMQAGADGYIAKPIGLDGLQAELRRLGLQPRA